MQVCVITELKVKRCRDSTVLLFNDLQIFNNRIVSLHVISYHDIFLHLKVRNTWNVGYSLDAFQKFGRSRDYNVYILFNDRIAKLFLGLFLASCLHFYRADFVVHIFIVYIFDFRKETTV
jgi:hypothetical protein